MITEQEIRNEFLELGYTEVTPNTYRTIKEEYVFDENIVTVKTVLTNGDKINRISGLRINNIEQLKYIMNNIV